MDNKVVNFVRILNFITSTDNKENFYSIGVFGVQFYYIEKYVSTHTHHTGKARNWRSLVENRDY